MEKINKSEETPCLNPIAVERAVTRAEWLEGIPPVRHTNKLKKTGNECTDEQQNPINVLIN